LGAVFVTLDELLAQSDFIILAVPLTNETKHMINSTTLGKMKKNAIVINVGRGGKVSIHTYHLHFNPKKVTDISDIARDAHIFQK
jgi:phosphoglycerate dehydrogenase-like enzyme